MIAGGDHACALTAGGVYCWGDNLHGELDPANPGVLGEPRPVAAWDTATRGALGPQHACFALAGGHVRCAGNNAHLELGRADGGDEMVALADAVVDLAAGVAQTCARSVTGALSCWGSNADGALGTGRIATTDFPPAPVLLDGGARSVAAHQAHACAVDAQETVQCWGWNERGQLGDPSTTSRSYPARAKGLPENIAVVTTGRAHTCAVTRSGLVFCWGDNAQGQLGSDTSDAGSWSAAPLAVPAANGAIAIAAADDFTCAAVRQPTSAVVCWGDGAAMGESRRLELPSAVRSLAAGRRHHCAVLESGKVVCWGAGENGQLGDGTRATRSTPVVPRGF